MARPTPLGMTQQERGLHATPQHARGAGGCLLLAALLCVVPVVLLLLLRWLG